MIPHVPEKLYIWQKWNYRNNFLHVINPPSSGPRYSPNLTVSQGLHLHMLQNSYTHTHYFQQSKQKNKLAFKKNKPAALRCLLEPWYEAVITTFLSQPNTDTREEQMFAFLRRAIFQQMRSRTTNIDGAQGSKQTEQGPCPCWDWAQPFPSSRSPLPAQGWVITLPEVCKQSCHTHRKKDLSKTPRPVWSNRAGGGHGHGPAPGSDQELFHMWALKQILEHSCSVLNAQTFREIQRVL